MIPSQVRAVLFDAVGTLIFPQPAVASAYHQIGARFGSTLTEREVGARFFTAFRRLEQGSLDDAGQFPSHQTDEQGERIRWQRIVDEVFRELPDSQAIFAALWEHFARPANWAAFDDSASVWSQLQQRGLALGVASNFDARLPPILQQHGPFLPCENWFVSSQLGWKKPAGSFFRAIESRLGLQPEELLLIGDDWENDYLAAQAAGWQAIWLTRDAGAKLHPEVKQINSLVELMR